MLAKIDLDANPRLGQALQVQSIPAIFAVVKGQPIPLFQGRCPSLTCRRYLDELLRVAAENGVNEGRCGGLFDADESSRRRTRYDEAYAAIERGMTSTLLRRLPLVARRLRRPIPTRRPAWARRRRTNGLDQAGQAKAAANPDDVAAQTAAADLDLLVGRVEDAVRG